MQEQKRSNKARIIGYVVGIAAFVVLAAWKFVVR